MAVVLEFSRYKNMVFIHLQENCTTRFNIILSICLYLVDYIPFFQGGATQMRFQPRAGRLLAVAAENLVSILDVETQVCRLKLQVGCRPFVDSFLFFGYAWKDGNKLITILGIHLILLGIDAFLLAFKALYFGGAYDSCAPGRKFSVSPGYIIPSRLQEGWM